MGPAVVDAVAADVADVSQHLPVVAEFGEGGGVCVGLETFYSVFLIQAEQGHTGLGVAPSAGVLLQVVPALQGGGGGHLPQAACRGRVLAALAVQAGAGVLPVAVNLIPVIEGLPIAKGAGGQHLFVGDQGEHGLELDAHLALDIQILAIGLPLACVRQILPREEAVLAVHVQLAEQADLQGDEGVVEAKAAESLHIGPQTQLGEEIGDGGGVGVAPLQAFLLAVPGGGLKAQLHGAAHLKAAGDRHDAHHGVHVKAEFHAYTGGKAAAFGVDLPIAGGAVIADLRLVVAFQLHTEVKACHIGQPVALVGIVGGHGVIGAVGHLLEVAHAGHIRLQALGHKVGADRHAVLVLHILQVQAVIASPDEGVEDTGVLAGGDEHLEHAGVHGACQLSQVAHQSIKDAIAIPAKVDFLFPAAGVRQGGHHAGDVLILLHRFNIGQVDGPKRHGALLHQGAVLGKACLEAHVFPIGDPPGSGHGLLSEGQGVLHHGHGGEGVALRARGHLGLGAVAVLIHHGQGVRGPVAALAPQEHIGGEHRFLEVVVGAHKARGIAGVDEGAVLQVVVDDLPCHKGFVRLTLGHFLQHHHAGSGAHLLHGADGAVHHLEQGVIGIVRNVADLQHILDLVLGGGKAVLGLPRLFGPELGEVEVDGELAVFVGGELGVLLSLSGSTDIVTGGAQTGRFAEIPVLVHAAPNDHFRAGQGRTIGRYEGQLCLGCLPQAEGVQGVELKFSGVSLAGLEVVVVDGAQVLRGLVILSDLRVEPHVAGDAAGLVEGQHAFAVGGHGPLLVIAVGIAQGGLHRRGHLEQVELVLQGMGGDRDAGAHIGGGVGGGDGRLAALHGGDAHFQLGQVGVKVEELDILVQAALLVVDGDLLVGGGPGDAVLKGVPVVIAVVDADVIQQAQLLPHGQDLLGGLGGNRFVVLRSQILDLLGVVQRQGINFLILAVHNLQRVGVVDIQGEGIGAGGLLPEICHRQHDLVGVLQIAFGHLVQVQRVSAGVAGEGLGSGGGLVIPGNPGDGEGGGLAGIIFQRPTDLHRARIVLQVEALGPGEHCGGGLGMYHNPRQGGKPDVLAGPIGMGHGHPHGVGGGFPSGETVQHVLRDQDAVLLLGGGCLIHGLARQF